MAITEIIEQLPGATGRWNLQSGHSLTVKLKARSDSRLDGPLAVLAALPLRIGDTYRYPITKPATETAAWLFVQDVAIDEVKPLADGGMIWTLSVAYSKLDPSKDDKGPVGDDGVRDPFAAPPKLSWRSQVEEEAKYRDRDGEVLLNKAGDPFIPPITVPRPVVVAVVHRVEREFSSAWVTEYMGRINDAEWLGWPAGSVLCLEITSDRDWNTDISGWVWNTEYQFAFKEPVLGEDGSIIRDGWTMNVLNAGMREKIASIDTGTGFALKQIIVDGAPISSPVNLKSDGRVLQPGGDPVFLPFNVYAEADFTGLNMPDDLFSAGSPAPPPEEPEDP